MNPPPVRWALSANRSADRARTWLAQPNSASPSKMLQIATAVKQQLARTAAALLAEVRQPGTLQSAVLPAVLRPVPGRARRSATRLPARANRRQERSPAADDSHPSDGTTPAARASAAPSAACADGQWRGDSFQTSLSRRSHTAVRGQRRTSNGSGVDCGKNQPM